MNKTEETVEAVARAIRDAEQAYLKHSNETGVYDANALALRTADAAIKVHTECQDGITDTEEALWALLDDIDMATDVFKPDRTPFVEYVYKTVPKRFKYLTSDGYTLSRASAQEKTDD